MSQRAEIKASVAGLIEANVLYLAVIDDNERKEVKILSYVVIGRYSWTLSQGYVCGYGSRNSRSLCCTWQMHYFNIGILKALLDAQRSLKEGGTIFRIMHLGLYTD